MESGSSPCCSEMYLMWGLMLKLLAGALLTLNSLLKWACMLNLMSMAKAMAGFP